MGASLPCIKWYITHHTKNLTLPVFETRCFIYIDSDESNKAPRRLRCTDNEIIQAFIIHFLHPEHKLWKI